VAQRKQIGIVRQRRGSLARRAYPAIGIVMGWIAGAPFLEAARIGGVAQPFMPAGGFGKDRGISNCANPPARR